MREQWNGYLDGLNGHDVSPETMSAHAQSNPGFSLTPENIPQIQQEHAAIRTGNAFGDMTTDQLAKMRQGLSDNFLSETNLNKSYYPTFQKGGDNLGTNAEAYVGGGGNSNDPVLPRPNMNDPKSRLAYLKNLAGRPGNSFLHGRGDYILNVNKVPSYGTETFHDSAVKSASKVGLDPALLYSSSQEEGASGLVPDEKGEIETGEFTNEKYPVDGFASYGLDNFHDNFKEMVKRGYLPKDFDYQKSQRTNETGNKVNSALFKSPEDAMQAKAAYVKMEQDNLEDWAKKNEVQMSPLAKQFFTLIAFNGGPGRAHILLNYYKKKGLLDGDKFLENAPEKASDPGGAYGHVLPRYQVAKLLKEQKYFE